MDTMDMTSDDSDGDTDHKIPDNMEATQADLPHIHDSSDSIAESVDQQDMQPQFHWIPNGLEGQNDNSSDHTEGSLQEICSDGSAEYSDQNYGPGCSPYNSPYHSPLPTICTSYTNIGNTEENQDLNVENPSPSAVCISYTHVDKAEQNQALYVDNPPIETEEFPSKDVYNTEGCNANNEVQYQLKDTFVKEAAATAYQCSGDVDDASVDRPDVQVDDEKSKAEGVDQDETRQQTVIKRSKDAEISDQGKSENTDDECIRPYAVAYCRDGHGKTTGEEDDVFDVQPYAVAYGEREVRYENQTPTGRSDDNFQSACGQPNTSTESVDGKKDGLQPNPMYSGNALLPNPMYISNALRPNPMYVPNVAQPRADGGRTCVASRSCLACVITTALVVVVLTVLTGLIIAKYIPGKQGSSIQKTWTDPTFTSKTTNDVTQHVEDLCTSSPPPYIEEKEIKDLKQTRIVFGEEGDEAGQLSGPYAVVVSPSSEIFVADTYNRRVQVFSMTGGYLRHFPAVVSRDEVDTIEPEDISIDGEGHLWVFGGIDAYMAGFVVRYTKMGHHLATLRATFTNNSFCGIAVDTIRKLVVVTEYWDKYGEVKLLHFNGTVVRKFRTKQGPVHPGLVAVGREGNLFVNDYWGDTSVYVYNNTGHYLFSFGGDKIGEVQPEIEDGSRVVADGIRVDSSGNVLVGTGSGGTVELFTEDGRYLRRVASGMYSSHGVAVGPAGQLVVTSSDNNTVTVFSHY
ncbi:TRIM3 [Branchiostoma lanceolatum]|uniref:TRIM3 protein n=1 Tax=Branchiostoma lanceolatum TaxID=7740 RepID=A0A8K0A9S5_BRALA|nr:TRIM3 [Branchiostoma lanceolatum]